MKEPINLGGMTIQFLVESEDSGGSVSVFRCDMAAGSSVGVPHSHDAFEETAYGLEGTVSYTVDGESTTLGPGEALLIPRGAVHSFVVDGDEDASVLFIASPGVFGPSYFQEIAEVVAAAAGGPPDKGALMAVMQRHGLTPAVPVAS
jgi:quercetin dioxygenase-like cupin family protein